VSGSSDVIEVPLSKGPNPGPIQTFEPSEPAASDGELILAGIIGDAHGPIIREEDGINSREIANTTFGAFWDAPVNYSTSLMNYCSLMLPRTTNHTQTSSRNSTKTKTKTKTKTGVIDSGWKMS